MIVDGAPRRRYSAVPGAFSVTTFVGSVCFLQQRIVAGLVEA
jgi:hypothetical protein